MYVHTKMKSHITISLDTKNVEWLRTKHSGNISNLINKKIEEMRNETR